MSAAPETGSTERYVVDIRGLWTVFKTPTAEFVIHKNLELALTPGGGQANQKPGALFLQDHGDPVRFRNIWIVTK